MVKWMCDAGYSMTGVRDLDLLLVCVCRTALEAVPALAGVPGRRWRRRGHGRWRLLQHTSSQPVGIAVSRGLCVISGCDGRWVVVPAVRVCSGRRRRCMRGAPWAVPRSPPPPRARTPWGGAVRPRRPRGCCAECHWPPRSRPHGPTYTQSMATRVSLRV